MKITDEKLGAFYKLSKPTLISYKKGNCSEYESICNRYKAFKTYYFLHACEGDDCISNYERLLFNLEAIKDFIEQCEYKPRDLNIKALESLGLTKEDYIKKNKEAAFDAINSIEEILKSIKEAISQLQ